MIWVTRSMCHLRHRPLCPCGTLCTRSRTRCTQRLLSLVGELAGEDFFSSSLPLLNSGKSFPEDILEDGTIRRWV